MHKHFKKILVTQEQIEKKCIELAQWVDDTYKDTKGLVLVGLLKGSIPFMAQLMKNIKTDHSIDFLTVSSYKGRTSAQGKPKIIMDLAHDPSGMDVLIVEDIVDTGNTLKMIHNMILRRDVKSVKVLTLIDKKEGRTEKFEVDKYGFTVPNVFLAGFGLDVNEKLRNLPFIGEFDKQYLNEY